MSICVITGGTTGIGAEARALLQQQGHEVLNIDYKGGDILAEGLRPLLKKKRGNCVITSSNSITNMTVRMDWVDMLSNVMDENRVLEYADTIPRNLTPSCYSSSKHVLARWVRRISASWAVDGLRINSVAPGNTTTPMTPA